MVYLHGGGNRQNCHASNSWKNNLYNSQLASDPNEDDNAYIMKVLNI